MKMITIIQVLFAATAAISFMEEPIKLDGSIRQSEWIGAKEFDLSSEGKLYRLRSKETLYIGIKGNSPGWAHVYLCWNDTVRVLHASAALGDQLYVYEKGKWKLQRKFNWELREFEDQEIVFKKQTLYYLKNRWCANNNNTGNKNTLEYKIDLKKFGNTKIKIAALFTSDGRSLSYYPSELNDHTLLEELVSGGNPDSLQLNPQTWATIDQ